MQTTIKNLINTKDYTTFLINNTAEWDSLKTGFTEELSQIKEPQESFIMGFIRGENSKIGKSIMLRREVVQKIYLVQQRLELIQNEWNRLQYYVAYKHEQIELHPELAESFFSYVDQELKSGITFH